MNATNKRLIQIAAWGGLIVSSTGFFLQYKLIERVQRCDYYKTALTKLRTHPGAVFYLGEPIKDKNFKITDPVNNNADEKKATFCIPVSGPKDRGSYHFWAEREKDEWKIVRAELELKSKPDTRLIIVK